MPTNVPPISALAVRPGLSPLREEARPSRAEDDACAIPPPKPGWLVRLGLASPPRECASVRGMRLPSTCRFVEIDDLRALPGHVPAGAHLAWDLDETLCLHESASGRGTATQTDTREVFRSLQKDHPTFGLTARPYETAFLTYFDMGGLGIEFPHAHEASRPYKTTNNAGHLGGIYFAGHGNPKGDSSSASSRTGRQCAPWSSWMTSPGTSLAWCRPHRIWAEPCR